MNKQEKAILSLPDMPDKHIYWVVYNKDMVPRTIAMFKRLREVYYDKYVTVVAKGDPTKDRINGHIYFDPTLMDLIGNGNG